MLQGEEANTQEGEALALTERNLVLQGQGALALQGEDLTLQGRDLTLQGGDLTRKRLAHQGEEALVQLGDQALAQLGGQTRKSNPSATRRPNPKRYKEENSSRLASIYYQFFRFRITFFVYVGKMTIKTKLDEKLEGVDNLRAWKYRVMLTLEKQQSGRIH